MIKEVKVTCEAAALVDLEFILPFQGNLKDLSKENYNKLRKQIIELGFTSPFIVWKNEGKYWCCDGHQRLRVLTEMKKSEGFRIPKLPVVFVEAATEHEAKKKILALTSSFGEITSQGLFEFASLNNIDLPTLEDFRFPEIDLDKFKSEFFDEPVEGLTDEDSVPEDVPVKSKRGDLYLLGDHRVLCGDSTDIKDVERLMNGEKADMVFTDPPYGVSYSGGHNQKKRQEIENDSLEGQDLTDLFYGALVCAASVTYDHAAFYVWYANGKAVETFASFSKLPLKVRAVICWYKIKSGLGAFMSQYIPNYEPCIYAFKEGCSPQWFGPTDEKTVWELKKESKNEFHPTQKPIELPERAITNSSLKNQIVLGLFGGSGSTLIACEKTNRKCFMMELDPHYCDVILARWEKFTGKTAVLETQPEYIPTASE